MAHANVVFFFVAFDRCSIQDMSIFMVTQFYISSNFNGYFTVFSLSQ